MNLKLKRLMRYCFVVLRQSPMAFFRMDQHTTKSFTSLTEMRVIRALGTSDTSFSWAADITDNSGYVVDLKVIVTLLYR